MLKLNKPLDDWRELPLLKSIAPPSTDAESPARKSICPPLIKAFPPDSPPLPGVKYAFEGSTLTLPVAKFESEGAVDNKAAPL